MKFLARAVIVMTILAFIQTADAQSRSKILDATDPERIAAAIQNLGYKARLEKPADSNAAIFSSVGGTEFVIQFHTCENGFSDCRVLLRRPGQC